MRMRRHRSVSICITSVLLSNRIKQYIHFLNAACKLYFQLCPDLINHTSLSFFQHDPISVTAVGVGWSYII